jgi:hypothetical protein
MTSESIAHIYQTTRLHVRRKNNLAKVTCRWATYSSLRRLSSTDEVPCFLWAVCLYACSAYITTLQVRRIIGWLLPQWSLLSLCWETASHYTTRIFIKKKTPWSESASELYRPSDRRLSAKWLPTFADRGLHEVRVTDPNGRILGFLDRSR